jgi:hypothetical protein
VSARTRLTRRTTAALAVLLIALTALPAMASARPIDAGPGYRLPSTPSTPAPTVVRTIVKQEAVRALPIVLAGAALIIAIAGTGFAMIRIAPLRQQLQSQH